MPNRFYRLKFANRDDAPMLGALAVVLLVGLAARSLVTIFPPLAVGDDGAYYLVQVHAIVRDGTLAIPDFPLLFYFQGGVASLLSIVMEQRAAVVAAVRVTDTLLPLALAVPVFLFARSFAGSVGHPGRGVVAVVLVGLMAIASGNALLMAGGMIKNAVALPCSLLFAFGLYRWLDEGRLTVLAWATFWFVLASLTHMGGLVLSTAFGIVVIAAGGASSSMRHRVLLPAVMLITALGGCLLLLYANDPERAQRLVHAVVTPGWLFADAPAWLWLRGISGEPLRRLVTSAEVWFGNTLGVLGVLTLWRHGTAMPAPTRVLLAGATVVTLAFSSPFLRPDVLERLVLLAYVPGMIPVVYLLCREAATAVILAPLTLAAVLHGALVVKTLRETALVPAAYEELVSFKPMLPPEQAIVITRPLLRWWVVWTMDVHFSTRVATALAAREAYSTVMVLDEIRRGAFGLAPGPREVGRLGAGVEDAGILHDEVVGAVAEGAYFRLSVVEAEIR